MTRRCWNPRRQKGQIFTTDYIIAIAIFLILLTVCVYSWDKTIQHASRDFLLQEMLNTGKRASDQLVRSPGSPSAWEDAPANVMTVGLAESDRVISQAKLTEIQNLDYTDLRTNLGLGNYDFLLRVQNSSNSVLALVGESPTTNQAVNFRRVVTMDGKPVVFDFIVWNSATDGSIHPHLAYTVIP